MPNERNNASMWINSPGLSRWQRREPSDPRTRQPARDGGAGQATECLIKDRDALLTFHDFPARHWQGIRTSNPTESVFAAIRHRRKRTKGCLGRDGMGHMMFRPGQCAAKSWHKLRGFAHLADIIKGVNFINAIKPSNQDQAAA